MTEVAKSAAPPWAVRVWSDGLTLYAELPGSPPYVMKFSHTESALSKVLSLLRKRFSEAKGGSYRVPERMISRKGATKEQRQDALAVLKKMGMV